MKPVSPIRISPKLHLIPLDQEIPGFTSFIGAWLYTGERTLIVDPGPAASIPRLVEAVAPLTSGPCDAILLTHIHIDHAGGVGDAVKQFDHPPVVCHPEAVPHLIDPSRLWEGSLKTLGDTAMAYGPIRAVPANLLVPARQCPLSGVLPIETPGHAVHHVSYLVGETLFAGEAGGVCYRTPKGDLYLRPATPPRFFLETSIRSIESLAEVAHQWLCYGHFGATRDTPELLLRHKEQIVQWEAIIRKEVERGTGETLLDRCMQRLLEEDPLLAALEKMDRPVRKRERRFIINSIRGFLGYIDRRNPSA